jgi:hypothetical protein
MTEFLDIVNSVEKGHDFFNIEKDFEIFKAKQIVKKDRIELMNLTKYDHEVNLLTLIDWTPPSEAEKQKIEELFVQKIESVSRRVDTNKSFLPDIHDHSIINK